MPSKTQRKKIKFTICSRRLSNNDRGTHRRYYWVGNNKDFRGEIRWNTSKPNGQPRRRLDVSKAEKEFGFKAKTDFIKGLGKTIQWYEKNPIKK